MGRRCLMLSFGFNLRVGRGGGGGVSGRGILGGGIGGDVCGVEG